MLPPKKNQKDFLILSLRRNPNSIMIWAFFNGLQFIGFTQEFFDSSLRQGIKVLELG
jgi:hypothetical protein